MAPDRAGPDRASADVVIVGAGLAGLQCARLVGEAGLDVVLLDRKEDLRDRVHTTGIFVRKSLEDFDLPPSCLGPPIRRVALYSPARRALRLSSRRDEFRVGRMGTLYRELLDRCLAAGVRFLPGTRYRGSRPAGPGLAVELECGGKGLNIETRLLVGADGANSQVARDLGLDSNSDWLVGLEWVYTGVPLSGPATLHCFLDPRIAPGYLAWVVQDGEETHVGVGGYPGRFRPQAALAEFAGSLGNLFALDRGRLVEQRGGRIPVNGVLRRIGGDRGLLVGDAAGAVSPLTAGGFDACLRLSRRAARRHRAPFRNRRPERAGDLFGGEAPVSISVPALDAPPARGNPESGGDGGGVPHVAVPPVPQPRLAGLLPPPLLPRPGVTNRPGPTAYCRLGSNHADGLERRPPASSPGGGRHSGPQGRGGRDPNRRDGSPLGADPSRQDGARRRSAGLRPASRGSAKPAPMTLRHANMRAHSGRHSGPQGRGVSDPNCEMAPFSARTPKQQDGARQRAPTGRTGHRSPTGIARERETSADDAAPCQREGHHLSVPEGRLLPAPAPSASSAPPAGGRRDA